MYYYTFISIVVKVGKMNNLSFGFVYSVIFFMTDMEALPKSFKFTLSIFQVSIIIKSTNQAPPIIIKTKTCNEKSTENV